MDIQECRKKLAECREQLNTLQKEQEQRLHPVLAYFLRVLGLAALFLGGAGLMTGFYFTGAAFLVCSAFVLLIIDPWLEPSLRKYSRFWRFVASIPFALGLFLFLRYIVYLPSPLSINARDYNEDYLPDTPVLYGIKWSAEYSDLRVVFENPTDYSYKDLDMTIEPTGLLVIEQTQTTNLSGVQIFNTAKGQDQVTATETDNKTGKKKYANPSDLQFMSGRIRMLCDTLPKHSMFEVLLAVHVISDQIPVSDALKLPIGATRIPAKTVRISGTFESRGGKVHPVNATLTVKIL